MATQPTDPFNNLRDQQSWASVSHTVVSSRWTDTFPISCSQILFKRSIVGFLLRMALLLFNEHSLRSSSNVGS